MINVGIWGIAAYVPSKVLTNNDFVKMGLDTSDEWISSRSGIRERRIADESESSSDLAYHAITELLSRTNTKPEDIECLIVATSTPDYLAFPSTAAVLQNRCGFNTIPAFDVSAACTGFNYGIVIGESMIKSGAVKNCIVVATDCLSKILNWEDRGTCVLFGDGAGAVLLGAVESSFGIKASSLNSDGSLSDCLKVPNGGSRSELTQDGLTQKLNTIHMDGKSVFKAAVKVIKPSILSACNQAEVELSEIDCFVFHQANIRIIKFACESLGIPESKVVTVLEKYGNTSAASVPLAAEEAVQTGLINNGDLVAFIGFGAGFTWSSIILRWGGRKND